MAIMPLYCVHLEIRTTHKERKGFFIKKEIEVPYSYQNYFYFSSDPYTSGNLDKIFEKHDNEKSKIKIAKVELFYYSNVNGLESWVRDRIDRID